MAPKILSRLDVQQRPSSRTGVVLMYIGRDLQWHTSLDGQRDHVFFAASAADIRPPERLATLAADIGMSIAGHPDYAKVVQYTMDALVADAWIDAPDLLADLAEPAVCWLSADRALLERRRNARVGLLNEQIGIIERDLVRRAQVRSTPLTKPVVTGAPATAEQLARVTEAMERARAVELPQRLPTGTRRAIDRAAPGAYVLHAALSEPMSLASAMESAAKIASDEQEALVIHHDGEWPVLVRRYAKGGRVVYRVEDALKRSGEGAAA